MGLTLAEPRDSLARLVEEFGKLPGVGPKTAERFVYYLLKVSKEEAQRLAQAVLDLKERSRHCSTCNNITETDPCAICRNPKRDQSVICVVEQPSDVRALEKPKTYHGLYHVLTGVLSPLDNITPEDLNVARLVERVKAGGVREVIIATNPSTEGDATAIYLARVISALGPKVSRIARGIPIGSGLGYVDEPTLREALEGRREMK